MMKSLFEKCIIQMYIEGLKRKKKKYKNTLLLKNQKP